MAIGAGGSRLLALNGLGVQTVVEGCLLVAMASRAGGLGRHGLVGRSLDVGMAIHAGKHASVHRVLELGRINVQAHRVAVDVSGEAGIAVAGEAVFVRGLSCRSRADGVRQNQDQAPNDGCCALHRSAVTFLWQSGG